MNYKGAVKKLKKYPRIVECDEALFRCRNIGAYDGLKAYWAMLAEKKGKLHLLHDPVGCREMFIDNVFHPRRDWTNLGGKIISANERVRYVSRDFIIVHLSFARKKDLTNKFKKLNEIEEECGINKTKHVYDGNKNYVLIVPSEWIYNSVILSAYMLFFRSKEKDDISKNLYVLMNYRKQIFGKYNNIFRGDHRFGFKYFIDGPNIYSLHQNKHKKMLQTYNRLMEDTVVYIQTDV